MTYLKCGVVQIGDILRCEGCKANRWHHLALRCSYKNIKREIGKNWVLVCSICGMDNEKHNELAELVAKELRL